MIISPDVEDMLMAIAQINGHTTIVPEDIEPAVDHTLKEAGFDAEAVESMTLRDKKASLIDLLKTGFQL